MSKIRQHLYEVCAVVVAYHPSHVQLDALIGALKGQVGRAVVVDNANRLEGRWYPAPGLEQFVHMIRLDDNLGVGYAQNVGARWAVEGVRGLCCCLIRTACRPLACWASCFVACS